MKNLKISMKQLVGFGIVILLSMVVGAVGIIGMVSLGSALDSLYAAASPLAELGTARENFQSARAIVWEGIAWAGAGAPVDEIRRLEGELDEQFEEFYSNMTEYQSSISTDEARDLWDDIMKYFNDTIEPGFHEIFKMIYEGASAQELKEHIYDYDSAADRVTEELDLLFMLRDEAMESTNTTNQAMADTLLITIIAVIAVTLAMAIFIGMYISKIISHPLQILRGYMDDAGTKGLLEMTPIEKEYIPLYSKQKDEIGETFVAAQAFFNHVEHIAEQLEKIADGDLTVHINVLTEEDILGNSLQKMEDSLNAMFGDINSSTVQVATGAKQVADGAQSLAQGSTEQAASIEELSASIADIADSTKANAQTASKAAELSSTIKASAEKGAKQMDEMMNAVREINEASNSISKVIKTIDDIAFQTNILALNAAVEAARAGQHGKGFAVVAEEVRNLAAKSAEAAKDTSGLIQNSMEKAELGSHIAGETATSLDEIVNGVVESTELIAQISEASNGQSMAISQINTGVDQVAQVVQQNSATAEQSAAASEEMSAQSTVLQELVAQFKLKDSR